MIVAIGRPLHQNCVTSISFTRRLMWNKGCENLWATIQIPLIMLITYEIACLSNPGIVNIIVFVHVVWHVFTRGRHNEVNYNYNSMAYLLLKIEQSPIFYETIYNGNYFKHYFIILKEYYEIVGESRSLSGFFFPHMLIYFTEMYL